MPRLSGGPSEAGSDGEDQDGGGEADEDSGARQEGESHADQQGRDRESGVGDEEERGEYLTTRRRQREGGGDRDGRAEDHARSGTGGDPSGDEQRQIRDQFPLVDLQLIASPSSSTGLAGDMRHGRIDVAFMGLPLQDLAEFRIALERALAGARLSRIVSAQISRPTPTMATTAMLDLLEERIVRNQSPAPT
jgi:hypothetical protein